MAPTSYNPSVYDAREHRVPLATARRYEFWSGTSHKFWQVSCKGSVVQVRFGRVGTEGQVRDKRLASAEQARRETEQLRNEPAPITHFSNVSFRRRRTEPAVPRRMKGGLTAWNAWLKARDRATIRWEIGGDRARDPLGQLESIPPAIASFTRDVKWTKRVFEDSGDRVERVDFGGASAGLDVDVEGARRILVVIATTAEYFQMTYVDLLDTSADPMTYDSDQDQLDVTRSALRRSGFLRGLTKRPG